MQAIMDETAVAEAWLDTPIEAPRFRTNSGEIRGPNSPSEAFETPGCHVKSRGMDERGRWPRYFGRLTSYDRDADRCVVISKGPMHGVDGKPTMWVGTFSEYAKMWRCD